ncbi:PAS domain-containing protein [Tardiphaga sp.]|jgi:PAS domain S-box-containing protein|uniref:PAS domain-containing protein n=1 Tax=Tardiphaga sp. TaxID=1926292 RepID=UPI0037D9C915
MDEGGRIKFLEAKLAAAEEAEAAYAHLFNAIDEGFCVIEVIFDTVEQPIDYRFLQINAAFEAQTGLRNAVGRKMRDLAPAHEAHWFEIYGRIAKTGAPERFEHRAEALGRWYEVYAFRVGAADQRRVGILFKDILTRKKAEADLIESEERLGLALEIGGLATWDWDIASGHVKWNERHFLMQGYAVGEVTPSFEAWLARVHPDDREATLAQIKKAQDQRLVYAHDFRSLNPQGDVRWCSARGKFFYDHRGQALRMIGVMEDVTLRKSTELALRESEERHRLLIESWTQAVWETDANGVVVADSQSWRAYTGQRLDEWLGHGWLNAIHPDDRAYAERQWREAIAARGLVNADFRLRSPLGGWRWTNVLAAPMLDATGEIEKWIGMNIDIDARKRAEGALRESETRFQQFAHASAAGMWIRDSETLQMEYVSPALSRIYGTDAHEFSDDMKRWVSLILPEDRDATLAHIDRARRGEAAVHEFRIRRPDNGTFRWIRNTDFPLFDADGQVQRIGGLAEDVTEAKLAIEHQHVLLAELQHRVRNIMAMIRSLALRTADGALDVDDYRSLLEGRLLALARVQVLLTRQANAGGSLREIIANEVGAQAHGDDQFELEGPEINLSPKAAEVITLAFHELATNALKYGAFSAPQGRLRVSWKQTLKRGRAWLSLDWTETGVPERSPPARRGFGADLIEGRIPYELGGSGKISFVSGQTQCRLELPLKSGESILETGAPAPVTTSGGTLDMSNGPDLSGLKVLVVEDDYYLAGDTAAAVRGAGAEVLGPCPDEASTFGLLQNTTPTHAVLDLNLGGGGPRFEIARSLKSRGVPLVFMTGYDPDVIPSDLEAVPRLQKPISLRKIVETLSLL